jgi:hypothetical protein
MRIAKGFLFLQLNFRNVLCAVEIGQQPHQSMPRHRYR